MTLLLCDPGWYVHKNLASRIGGMTTHTNTGGRKNKFSLFNEINRRIVSSNRCRKQSKMFTTSSVVVMVSLFCTIKSGSMFSVRLRNGPKNEFVPMS